jgi:hypothetical protein
MQPVQQRYHPIRERRSLDEKDMVLSAAVYRQLSGGARQQLQRHESEQFKNSQRPGNDTGLHQQIQRRFRFDQTGSRNNL